MEKTVFSMKENLIGKQKRASKEQRLERIANLKRNWFLPVSAAAFFCLTFNYSLGCLLGFLIAFPLMIVIASRIPPVWDMVRQNSVWGNIFCIASAAGICLGNMEFFYKQSKNRFLAHLPQGMAEGILVFLSCFGAVVACFFVFICLLYFWKAFKRTLERLRFFDGIEKKEWIIYGLLFAVLVAQMVVAFAQTNAFYEPKYPYDIVYTSDSALLLKSNVYVAPTHPENDIRQPLFGVFAAPFTGIAYFISKLTGAPASIQSMLLDGMQLIMLLAANLMLARMLKLNAAKRICFMLLFACTYMQLLFGLMMEQYIVSYFWLAFCMYAILEGKQTERLPLWGAGGSMLTSMILLPLMSGKSPVRDFKRWFCDTVKYGFEFLALILVFCRFDAIYTSVSRILFLTKFAGHTVPLAEKIHQYTQFVLSCFAAPDAGMTMEVFDRASWQMKAVTGISIAGVVILALSAISVIWNRKKRSSLLAGGWVLFSVVLLLGLGWGTQENGLVLYTLYFGWAFLVLLFQLLEKIVDKLKLGFLFPIICACGMAALLAINIPAILELIRFAISYYPV